MKRHPVKRMIDHPDFTTSERRKRRRECFNKVNLDLHKFINYCLCVDLRRDTFFIVSNISSFFICLSYGASGGNMK